MLLLLLTPSIEVCTKMLARLLRSCHRRALVGSDSLSSVNVVVPIDRRSFTLLPLKSLPPNFFSKSSASLLVMENVSSSPLPAQEARLPSSSASSKRLPAFSRRSSTLETKSRNSSMLGSPLLDPLSSALPLSASLGCSSSCCYCCRWSSDSLSSQVNIIFFPLVALVETKRHRLL